MPLSTSDLPNDDVVDGAPFEHYFSAGRHRHGRPVVPLYPACGRVRAGSYLYVEPGVELMVGGNHRLDWVTTFPVHVIYGIQGGEVGHEWSKGDIVIGHGVRLGREAKVLSGVRIGDGAAVAPYSVVVRDVRPYALVAGNPAAEVGLRFTDKVVGRLSGCEWWGWHDHMTGWRLDRLTRGRAHDLVPQLGRATHGTPARVRRLLAHLLLAIARRVDASAPSGQGPPVHGPASLDGGLPESDSTPGSPDDGLNVPGTSVPMGRGSYGRPVVYGPVDQLMIGNYCSIGPNCAILVDADPTRPLEAAARQGHRFRPVTTSAAQAGADVRIGSDVWVGRGARLLPGVSIGDGAVVAAYSVVGHDVRPFAVVAGNPAREVKRRFDDATVDALLRIRWWEWSEEIVKERAAELCSTDVAGFIARNDPLAAGGLERHRPRPGAGDR